MLFVVCRGPLSELKKDILEFEDKVDGIELRLDLVPSIEWEDLHVLRRMWKKKLIFTLRTVPQGGSYSGTEEERYSVWQRLLGVGADYVDIEYDAPEGLFALVRSHPLRAKLILSYHDFDSTPDLEMVYRNLLQTPADIYKIATFARSTIDSLRMLQLMTLSKNEACCLIGICMGELGKITRILSPVLGGYLTYTSFQEKKTAPGQIDLDQLLNEFRYKCLNPETKVYGLIGYPIDKSLSPLAHNSIWSQKNINSFYIKMPLQEHELEDFFKIFRSLPFFQGLSVTMPLKEAVGSYLDERSPLAEYLQAVNTVYRKNSFLYGDNTDMQGALTAIEKKLDLNGKKVLILGAGGAASALAYGCLQKNAHVHIVNRSLARGEALAERLGCTCSELNKEEVWEYDLLINTTPDPMPISCKQIKEGSYVMDITTYLSNGSLIEEAKKKGCICIDGITMFMHQAILQQNIWSDYEEVDLQEILEPLLLKRGS